MSVFGLEYPIGAARRRITQYPNIGAGLPLPPTGSSPREMVRLLDDPRYDHIDAMLALIDRWLPAAGPIGDRLLDTTTPDHLAQAFAELALLAHLRGTLGPAARPAVARPDERGPDIEVELDKQTLRIEVYTPIELAPFQLFDRHLIPALNYLDVATGYGLSLTIGPRLDTQTLYERAVTMTEREFNELQIRHFFYADFFPPVPEVRRWFAGFLEDFKTWLTADTSAPRTRRFDGPGDVVRVDATVERFYPKPTQRFIAIHGSGPSRSTEGVFRDARDLTATEWGRKIGGKLRKRQAGPPAAAVLRVLVVNFMLGQDRPDFFGEGWFARRFHELVTRVAGAGEPPYDAVVPALLGLECGFGPAAVLATDRAGEVARLIAAAGMNRLPESPPQLSPEELFEELAGGDGPPRDGDRHDGA